MSNSKCGGCGRGDWFGEVLAAFILMGVLMAVGFCVAAWFDGLTARIGERIEPLPTAPAPLEPPPR